MENKRVVAQNQPMRVYPSFTVVLAPPQDPRTHRARALHDALETSLLPLGAFEPVSHSVCGFLSFLTAQF